MLFEYINLILGILKVLIYKLLYFRRLSFFDIPKMNNSFKIIIKKNSKLNLKKGFRSRNNISFRIYDGGEVFIGKNGFLNDGCSINCQKKITIGDNFLCGQNVTMFDHDHDYKNDINKFIKKEIIIGNNVWIGANCTILKGVKIGNNVVIGANSIIKNDIPDNCVVYQKRVNLLKER